MASSKRPSSSSEMRFGVHELVIRGDWLTVDFADDATPRLHNSEKPPTKFHRSEIYGAEVDERGEALQVLYFPLIESAPSCCVCSSGPEREIRCQNSAVAPISKSGFFRGDRVDRCLTLVRARLPRGSTSSSGPPSREVVIAPDAPVSGVRAVDEVRIRLSGQQTGEQTGEQAEKGSSVGLLLSAARDAVLDWACGSARPRNFLVFVNPAAGQGKAEGLWSSTVEPLLQKLKSTLSYEVIRTTGAGMARKFCAGLESLTKYDGILILSGDGLVHEVGFFGLV